ncbi:MAG TPA: hypothetical protein P5164_13130 [Thermoanaerobaculia bacterium]|nr:hypothetical protein [Thermoanaerobaculia bacterium]
MSHPTFPWPWRGPENRKLALVVLLWLAALQLWAFVSVRALPIGRPSPWSEEATRRAPAFARFDSGWYNSIVEKGYPPPPAAGAQSEHAFFPLYPMTARAIHLATGLDSFRAAVVVSWTALLLAVPLLAAEARERFGEGTDRGALPFLLLYPVAFFLAAVYTESLFLLLALLAFRASRRNELAPALLFGLLLGLTRAPAVAVGPGLAVAWWLAGAAGARRAAGAALLLVAPLAGVLAWVFGIGLLQGEPMLFFRSMSAWRASAGNPFAGAVAFVLEPVRMLRTGWFREHPGAVAPFVHFGLFALLGAFQLRMRRWADAAWTAGVLGLAVATGTADGVPRYTLTVYPGHFAAAALCETRPRLKALWLGTSLALLLLNSAFFVSWHFVS